MVSTFAYGLKTGMTPLGLVLVNTGAVITDMALFFVPAYILADRLHTFLQTRLASYYARATGLVGRVGVFRTSLALAFVLPSVAAMLVVGLLRLDFWRAALGLLIGSAVYVVIPLLLALPLANVLPAYLVPLLRWVAPVLAVIVIVASLARSQWSSRAHGS